MADNFSVADAQEVRLYDTGPAMTHAMRLCTVAFAVLAGLTYCG
jgi:hypothetical protein